MQLDNRTEANAGLLRSTLGEDRILAGLIVRPTFRIGRGGQLEATPEFPWPVGAVPLRTPLGELPGDVPFLSGGVDVLVTGNVTTSPGKPTDRLDISLRIGPRFERSLAVFGDRRWLRDGDALVPSAPRPFTSMALSYDNAFGGKAVTEHGELGWPPNSHGKGFYLDAEAAEGSPLPNLEDPRNLIRTFEDRPRVVGTAPYPADGSLSRLNAVDPRIDEEEPERSRLMEIKPLLFNVAHPDMIVAAADAPRAGDRVEVRGVRAGADVRFDMPDISYHVHVQLEDRNHLFPLHLDQIGILLDDLRIFLSYRVVFRYRLVKFERRRATLYNGAPPDSVPDEYVVDWSTLEPAL